MRVNTLSLPRPASMDSANAYLNGARFGTAAGPASWPRNPPPSGGASGCLWAPLHVRAPRQQSRETPHDVRRHGSSRLVAPIDALPGRDAPGRCQKPRRSQSEFRGHVEPHWFDSRRYYGAPRAPVRQLSPTNLASGAKMLRNGPSSRVWERDSACLLSGGQMSGFDNSDGSLVSDATGVGDGLSLINS